jgi:hypothetical protein
MCALCENTRSVFPFCGEAWTVCICCAVLCCVLVWLLRCRMHVDSIAVVVLAIRHNPNRVRSSGPANVLTPVHDVLIIDASDHCRHRAGHPGHHHRHRRGHVQGQVNALFTHQRGSKLCPEQRWAAIFDSVRF